jgi:hypothetical protein
MTVEVLVHAYPINPLGKTFKKIMTHKEFLKLKDARYNFRSFQIGYNTTIIND